MLIIRLADQNIPHEKKKLIKYSVQKSGWNPNFIDPGASNHQRSTQKPSDLSKYNNIKGHATESAKKKKEKRKTQGAKRKKAGSNELRLAS